MQAGLERFPALVRPGGGFYDAIYAYGIDVYGYHGVFESEKQTGQHFVADVVAWVDTRAAASTDELAGTVSYAEIVSQVQQILAGPPVDLLETLSQKIADSVLAMSKVRGVDVAIHKMQAPIEGKFSDVGVQIRRLHPLLCRPEQYLPGNTKPERVPTFARITVALGANEGLMGQTFARVIDAFDRHEHFQVLKVSPFEMTKAVLPPDVAPQPDYCNGLLIANTDLSPLEVLAFLQSQEALWGRVRDFEVKPRALDLDLIDYAIAGQISLISSDSQLLLPHPEAFNRDFVWKPWKKFDPQGASRLGRSSWPLSTELEGN